MGKVKGTVSDWSKLIFALLFAVWFLMLASYGCYSLIRQVP